MSTSHVKRKLAAILAADAVGFSRQMGVNEERTMRVLAAHRAVIDGIIEFREGRIVGTAGDSVLAEFASPVEALRCAVEIQDAIKTRNDSLPEADRMQFRIGINLGDVMVKGDDLLGDGVNVAARLESIAEPGGICISSSVYDQIAGKLDLGFVEIGEQNLKNIARPVRVYRVNRGAPAGNVSPRTPRRAWLYALGAALVLLAAIPVALNFREGSKAPAPAIAPAQPTSTSAATTEAARTQESRDALERAKAEHDAAEARAAAEIAKARADAEVARARAETAALRRQAAADLAAARKPVEPASAAISRPAPATPTAAPVLPATPAAPTAAAVLPASPAAPTATARATPAAAAWSAQRHCPAGPQTSEFSDELSVSENGGELAIEKGIAGQPGYFTLRGREQADRRLVLSGHMIPGRGPMLGQQVPASFEGRRDGDRYEMKGRTGRLECSLTLTRR